MSISQRSVFIEYLKDTILEKITVANGYNLTLKTKSRGLKHPQTLAESEFPAIFISSADEDIENVSNKHYMSVMSVYFHCFVYANETDRVQIELDKIIADITKAVYEGGSVGGSDPTHDTKVAWSKLKTIRTDQGDMTPYGEAVVTFEFKYVRTGTNP